jgi:hypothetical protein
LILTRQGVEPQLAVKYAIATSMSVILFTSLSSAWAHHRRGAVRWRLVLGLAPGILLGGLLAGAGAFPLLKGTTLSLLFALFVAFTGTQLLRDAKPSPSRQLPGPAGTAAAGGVIGFVSGLVGAGGAFISIPFMVWCNVAIHNAGKHGGLCGRRLVTGRAAAGFAGLCVAAGPGDTGLRGRVAGAPGRTCSPRDGHALAQARLRMGDVRAGRLHAVACNEMTPPTRLGGAPHRCTTATYTFHVRQMHRAWVLDQPPLSDLLSGSLRTGRPFIR